MNKQEHHAYMRKWWKDKRLKDRLEKQDKLITYLNDELDKKHIDKMFIQSKHIADKVELSQSTISGLLKMMKKEGTYNVHKWSDVKKNPTWVYER